MLARSVPLSCARLVLGRCRLADRPCRSRAASQSSPRPRSRPGPGRPSLASWSHSTAATDQDFHSASPCHPNDVLLAGPDEPILHPDDPDQPTINPALLYRHHRNTKRPAEPDKTQHSDDEDLQTFAVPCRSSGTIYVHLRNFARHSPLTPLFVYVPPFSSFVHVPPQYQNQRQASDTAPVMPKSPLPPFLRPWPTATIEYRWQSGRVPSFHTPHQWPTPILDVATAYAWIVHNLAPASPSRRDIYLFGSRLGASLGAALALTESRPQVRFAIRRLVAYNGIYNWTRCLPGHPAYIAPTPVPAIVPAPALNSAPASIPAPPDPVGHDLHHQATQLFRTPSGLFDSFASPCLFFQTAGVWVPKAFNSDPSTPSHDPAIDPDPLYPPYHPPSPFPRRSSLLYPPLWSSLKVPQTLLLYDRAPPPLPPPETTRRRRRPLDPHHLSFEMQARELDGVIRAAIVRVSKRAAFGWDEDDWDEARAQAAASNRVQLTEVTHDQPIDQILQSWLPPRRK